jgi:hypothetical protein
MVLKFTPRSIMEIENEQKKPVQDALADFSIRTLVLFVKKGMPIGTDDEAALAEVEKYLAEDKNDTTTLYTMIMEALQKDGFLPRGLNIAKVKADMQKAMKAL